MELTSPTALSALMGRKVVDQSGRRLGRVYEAKAHWERDGTVVGFMSRPQHWRT